MKLNDGETIESVTVTALHGHAPSQYGNQYVTTILTNEGRLLQKRNDSDWIDITPTEDN